MGSNESHPAASDEYAPAAGAAYLGMRGTGASAATAGLTVGRCAGMSQQYGSTPSTSFTASAASARCGSTSCVSPSKI